MYITPSISHNTSLPAVLKDCLPLRAIFLFPDLSVIFFAPGIREANASTNDIDEIAFCCDFNIGSS